MTSVIVYLVGFNGTRANSGQKIQNAGCGQPQDQIRPWGGALPKQLENQVSLCGCTRGNFNAKRMYCIYYLHTCIFSIKFCITWISLQPQALNILCALDKSLTPPPHRGPLVQ